MAYGNDSSDDTSKALVWREFASYVVEFSESVDSPTEQGFPATRYRTRAHFIEKELSCEWSGLSTVELTHWLVQTTSDLLLSRQNRRTSAHRPMLVLSLLEGVKGDEASGANIAGSKFLGHSIESQSLQFSMSLSLFPETVFKDVTAHVPVGLYLHAYRQHDGQFFELGAHHESIPGSAFETKSHTFTDIEFGKGQYRIFGIAIVYTKDPILISTEGHLISIV